MVIESPGDWSVPEFDISLTQDCSEERLELVRRWFADGGEGSLAAKTVPLFKLDYFWRKNRCRH